MNTENLKLESENPADLRRQDFSLWKGRAKKIPTLESVTKSKPSAAGSIWKRRRPEAQTKKNQPPKATGFSQPCAGCADVVTRWRFELQTHCLKGSCSTY